MLSRSQRNDGAESGERLSLLIAHLSADVYTEYSYVYVVHVCSSVVCASAGKVQV